MKTETEPVVPDWLRTARAKFARQFHAAVLMRIDRERAEAMEKSAAAVAAFEKQHKPRRERPRLKCLTEPVRAAHIPQPSQLTLF